MRSNLNIEWSANDYAIGSIIQKTISDELLQGFQFYSKDNLLDIGCGDGAYTINLSRQLTEGSITAIDASSNMIKFAQSRSQPYNNINFLEKNALYLDYQNQFSVVTALWSLRWIADLERVVKNVYRALQNNGRFFAIIPHHDSAYMRLFNKVRESKQFLSLANFVPPVSYFTLDDIQNFLTRLPFKKVSCKYRHFDFGLPNLDTFRKFLNGISFFKNQIAEEEILLINEEMVKIFAKECAEQHANKYIFADDYIVINTIK